MRRKVDEGASDWLKNVPASVSEDGAQPRATLLDTGSRSVARFEGDRRRIKRQWPREPKTNRAGDDPPPVNSEYRRRVSTQSTVGPAPPRRRRRKDHDVAVRVPPTETKPLVGDALASCSGGDELCLGRKRDVVGVQPKGGAGGQANASFLESASVMLKKVVSRWSPVQAFEVCCCGMAWERENRLGSAAVAEASKGREEEREEVTCRVKITCKMSSNHRQPAHMKVCEAFKAMDDVRMKLEPLLDGKSWLSNEKERQARNEFRRCVGDGFPGMKSELVRAVQYAGPGPQLDLAATSRSPSGSRPSAGGIVPERSGDTASSGASGGGEADAEALNLTDAPVSENGSHPEASRAKPNGRRSFFKKSSADRGRWSCSGLLLVAAAALLTSGIA